MPLDVEQLGKRITQLRELHPERKSMSALAEAAGVAKSYLLRIERGEVENPGLNTLNSISRALGVTIADLLSPLEAAPKPEGRAAVNKEREFARILASAPASLKAFLEEERENGRPVAADDVISLATVKFRGKTPGNIDDWRLLYLMLKKVGGGR